MYTEHKPYEPAFYATVNNDWGSSLLLAQAAGPRASCLVDLGHHLPNANIEQIVSRLAMVGRLGGFHFNDSKYGDDDLTTGSIKPFQLFLIFCELIRAGEGRLPSLAYMIDQSHNIKDPLEDLIQSTEAVAIAYAQAMMVDRAALAEAQDRQRRRPRRSRSSRTRSAPTCGRWWPRRGGATAEPSLPLEAYRAVGYRRAMIERARPGFGGAPGCDRSRRGSSPSTSGRPRCGWPPSISTPPSRRWRCFTAGAHDPVAGRDGTLRWDGPRSSPRWRQGLEAALATGPVASIGVDGWGVDYGLIDAERQLVAPPFSYRDPRTDRWETTVDAIGAERLYEVTGIQMMAVNTIFQLAVHDRSRAGAGDPAAPPPRPARPPPRPASREPNAPTHRQRACWTSGPATGPVELIDDIRCRRSLFPDVVSAGRLAGSWRGVPIHLVGSHDTASAFLGMPGGSTPGTVFVSTGTWVIVGVERPERRQLGGGPGGQLLQRGRRPRWNPVPQECGGLLDARTVPSRLGRSHRWSC